MTVIEFPFKGLLLFLVSVSKNQMSKLRERIKKCNREDSNNVREDVTTYM